MSQCEGLKILTKSRNVSLLSSFLLFETIRELPSTDKLAYTWFAHNFFNPIRSQVQSRIHSNIRYTIAREVLLFCIINSNNKLVYEIRSYTPSKYLK